MKKQSSRLQSIFVGVALGWFNVAIAYGFAHVIGITFEKAALITILLLLGSAHAREPY